MKYLMDVNLLIAAIWSTHTNHQKADAWTKDKELVTCPISELGFLRISDDRKISIVQYYEHANSDA